MEGFLNVHGYQSGLSIYGPGTRFVIWFQGCKIKCKGCWNTEMHSMEDNNLYTPEALAEKITLDGVTLLGGEPLNQNLTELLQFLKLIKEAGKSVVLFTGYEYSYVKEHFPEVIPYIDILVAGRYDESKRTTDKYLIGSTNQEILFLTDRYSEKDMLEDRNYTEIVIKDGNIAMYGFPSDDLINEVIK